ncbi:50S ribosomal protein L13 [Camellia lanceoleosa]|uniref:50S ribosomal protein L13 n=1 Tax=Camellia lanceoleosa TaxID=1840588 RepID=A0ACC0J3F4_9ERIC|nr:50S ribosomal protein L13 [Camellia lanceoleosa]
MDFIHLAYMYVGHLKERSLKDQLAKDPTEVIRKAVLRMLPRNKLRDVSTTKTSFSLSQYEELKIKLNPFEFGIILFKEY